MHEKLKTVESRKNFECEEVEKLKNYRDLYWSKSSQDLLKREEHAVILLK